LIVDIDPQGNASTGLGIPRSERKLTTYDVLMGQARLGEAIVATRIPRLSLVPSTVDLSGAELELIGIERRNYRLKDALAEYSAHGSSPFSYVLIDCPPSLSLLTVNAMVAADAVVVPLQMRVLCAGRLEPAAQDHRAGAHQLESVAGDPGHRADHVDKRNRLSDQVAADVRQNMGAMVYNTMIPRKRAGFRSAEPRPAGAGLRSQMSGKPSLYQACGRTHSA